MSYVTHEAMRLGLCGLAAGSAAGLTWRAAGRVRWGPLPFVLAVLVAARFDHRSDWPRWDAMAAAGAVVVVLAGFGAGHLLAESAGGWQWVAAGSLISAAGVWAGVPETGPALLAGGGLTGLALSAALTRARWGPAAGAGVAAVIGWAALSGAAGRPWASIGGALCAGMAPWYAVPPLFSTRSRAPIAGPWLLGAHAVLVILAARWIGVQTHAGWPRVALLAAAGVAVAGMTRRRA